MFTAVLILVLIAVLSTCHTTMATMEIKFSAELELKEGYSIDDLTCPGHTHPHTDFLVSSVAQHLIDLMREDEQDTTGVTLLELLENVDVTELYEHQKSSTPTMDDEEASGAKRSDGNDRSLLRATATTTTSGGDDEPQHRRQLNDCTYNKYFFTRSCNFIWIPTSGAQFYNGCSKHWIYSGHCNYYTYFEYDAPYRYEYECFVDHSDSTTFCRVKNRYGASGSYNFGFYKELYNENTSNCRLCNPEAYDDRRGRALGKLEEKKMKKHKKHASKILSKKVLDDFVSTCSGAEESMVRGVQIKIE